MKYDQDYINEFISFHKENGLDQYILDYIVKHELFSSFDPVFAMLDHYYFDQKYLLNNMTLTNDIIQTYQPFAELCAIMDGNAFLSMTTYINKKEVPWFYMYLPTAMSILNSVPNKEINTHFLNSINNNIQNQNIPELTKQEEIAFKGLIPFINFLGLSNETGLIWLKKYIFKCGGYTGWPGEASFVKNMLMVNT